MQDWHGPTGWLVVLGGALVALAAGLTVALVRTRRATGVAVREAMARSADLQSRLDELERRLAPGGSPTPGRPAGGVPAPEFLITDLGVAPHPVADEAAVPSPRIGGALFADLVLRESVVTAASLAHGLRRALAPETRNRIRFEMRRELRRARKQRRADLRAARRLVQARDRVAPERLDDAGTAA
jgi:hypothetical protein